MAYTQIGRIFILQSHNGHTENDDYQVLFDPDLTLYKVFRSSTSSYVTTLPGIFLGDNPILPNYERDDYRVEFIVGVNTILYFNSINSFPYFETKIRSIVDGGVNDLLLYVTSITAATNGNNDGSVTLSATGFNTPFQYKKGEGAYQDSNVFSSLYAGEYIFTCRDSVGNLRSITVIVPSNQIPIEGDTHAVKYRGDFYQHRPLNSATNNIRHRVEILERDYSGSVETLTFADTPVTISVRTEQSDYIGDSAIITHQLNVNIRSATFRQYLDFGMGDDYKYMVLYYIDDSVGKNGTDFNVRFKGFITPESYSENFGDPPYFSSFTASDRLADLQGLYFYEEGFLDQTLAPINTRIKGSLSQLNIIDKCLRKIRMNQGYRIAIDIFEESFDDANTDTPLVQAYENCDSFYDKSNADDCADVIRKILKPYGAFLMSWDNYWYIIKEQSLKDTTVNYVELSTFDDATGVAGSWSPRITHKSATNTSLFRFSGSQNLNVTRAIKTISVTSNAKLRDAGMTDGFVEDNASFDERGNFIGFDGFELVVNNSISSRPYNELVVYDPIGSKQIFLRASKITGWRLKYAINYNLSESYIRLSNSLTWKTADTLNLKFDVAATGGFGAGYYETTDAPYYILKWQLKVGSYYLSQVGEWSLTETTNQYWISQEAINKADFLTVNIESPFRDTLSAEQYTEDYELKIFPVSAWEYDLQGSTKANGKTALEGLSTTNLEAGTRRVLRYTDSSIYYFNYYELRRVIDGSSSTASLTEVKPDDSTVKRWFLVSSWGKTTSLDPETDVRQATTIIKDFSFTTLPFGEKPPTQFGDSGVVNYENNISLHVQLDSFDLTNNVSNDENLYVNYTRRSDGSPTTIWNNAGGVSYKPRQTHLLDRLYELYRRPRLKISSTFYSDLEISALKTLYLADDESRVYGLSGITMNPKNGVHSGEMIEIYSSETPTRGDYNDDYDNDNDYL